MAMTGSPYSSTLLILFLSLSSLSLCCSAFTSQDYSDALEKSILFFEGQWSGKLPPTRGSNGGPILICLVAPPIRCLILQTGIEELTVSLNSVVCPFYCSYLGYQDELLWGASWIPKASQNDSYVASIQSTGHTLGADDDAYSFRWDDKRAGTKILLSKVFASNFTRKHLYRWYRGSPVPQEATPPFELRYLAYVRRRNVEEVTY
ncbi:cellulase 3 [Actinidia rufa]|uniref:cellulase n=1 Tax=Actinidia rufa TaxID=165716 RepID=A0A7J0FRQ1_9ERIC|nr:cellulase 3 [Actinidia rufa]